MNYSTSSSAPPITLESLLEMRQKIKEAVAHIPKPPHRIILNETAAKMIRQNLNPIGLYPDPLTDSGVPFSVLPKHMDPTPGEFYAAKVNFPPIEFPSPVRFVGHTMEIVTFEDEKTAKRFANGRMVRLKDEWLMVVKGAIRMRKGLNVVAMPKDQARRHFVCSNFSVFDNYPFRRVFA